MRDNNDNDCYPDYAVEYVGPMLPGECSACDGRGIDYELTMYGKRCRSCKGTGMVKARP